MDEGGSVGMETVIQKAHDCRRAKQDPAGRQTNGLEMQAVAK